MIVTGYIIFWDKPDKCGQVWKRESFDPSLLQNMKKNRAIVDYECTKIGVKITVNANVPEVEHDGFSFNFGVIDESTR